LPYVKTEGCPPAPRAGDEPQGCLRYLIRKKPLDYRKTVAWRSIERHVSYSDLHKQNQEVVLLMVLGAVTGQSTLYSNSIPDQKQRFHRILEHLLSRGTLPCPQALMAEPGGLTVLAGNHRTPSARKVDASPSRPFSPPGGLMERFNASLQRDRKS